MINLNLLLVAFLLDLLTCIAIVIVTFHLLRINLASQLDKVIVALSKIEYEHQVHKRVRDFVVMRLVFEIHMRWAYRWFFFAILTVNAAISAINSSTLGTVHAF